MAHLYLLTPSSAAALRQLEAFCSFHSERERVGVSDCRQDKVGLYFRFGRLTADSKSRTELPAEVVLDAFSGLRQLREQTAFYCVVTYIDKRRAAGGAVDAVSGRRAKERPLSRPAAAAADQREQSSSLSAQPSVLHSSAAYSFPPAAAYAGQSAAAPPPSLPSAASNFNVGQPSYASPPPYPLDVQSPAYYAPPPALHPPPTSAPLPPSLSYAAPPPYQQPAYQQQYASSPGRPPAVSAPAAVSSADLAIVSRILNIVPSGRSQPPVAPARPPPPAASASPYHSLPSHLLGGVASPVSRDPRLAHRAEAESRWQGREDAGRQREDDQRRYGQQQQQQRDRRQGEEEQRRDGGWPPLPPFSTPSREQDRGEGDYRQHQQQLQPHYQPPQQQQQQRPAAQPAPTAAPLQPRSSGFIHPSRLQPR